MWANVNRKSGEKYFVRKDVKATSALTMNSAGGLMISKVQVLFSNGTGLPESIEVEILLKTWVICVVDMGHVDSRPTVSEVTKHITSMMALIMAAGLSDRELETASQYAYEFGRAEALRDKARNQVRTSQETSSLFEARLHSNFFLAAFSAFVAVDCTRRTQVVYNNHKNQCLGANDPRPRCYVDGYESVILDRSAF